MLCLAVKEGKLVLYYDFNGGLKMASPSKDSADLIVSRNTNKAVMTKIRCSHLDFLPGSETFWCSCLSASGVFLSTSFLFQ